MYAQIFIICSGQYKYRAMSHKWDCAIAVRKHMSRGEVGVTERRGRCEGETRQHCPDIY